MVSSFTGQEVVALLSLAKVVASEAVQLVLTDMGVNNVKQHGDAHPMRSVYQCFQLLWVTRP